MFKSLIFSLLLPFFISSDFPQNGKFTLNVSLDNVKCSAGGSIFIELVDQNDKPVVRTKKALSENNLVFSFPNLTAASYAVRIFHDQNSNDRLDKGIFGQPTEGWGVSNNVRGFMSAPDFKKMLVRVERDAQISVKLSY